MAQAIHASVHLHLMRQIPVGEATYATERVPYTYI